MLLLDGVGVITGRLVPVSYVFGVNVYLCRMCIFRMCICVDVLCVYVFVERVGVCVRADRGLV